MKEQIIEIGNTVLCDSCNEDYTDRETCGGVLFCSSGYCPDCAPRIIAKAKEYSETAYIREIVPPTEQFRRAVLRWRGGRNYVTIQEFDSTEEMFNQKKNEK